MPADPIRGQIEADLKTLAASATFAAAPKKFEKEERAVRDTLLRFVKQKAEASVPEEGMVASLLSYINPPSQRDLLMPAVETDSIERMTKLGHLTVIAESLDDPFLADVEKMLKGPAGDVSFTSDGKFTFTDSNSITLRELYERCKHDLDVEAGKIPPTATDRVGPHPDAKKDPDFADVLLRMYTADSPFFKKLNGTVAGYEVSKTTTPEEREMSFVLNIAIHKAGLEKAKAEAQATPDLLLRGQSWGAAGYVEMFKKTKQYCKDGSLSKLSPAQLKEINMVGIAAKKTLSTTSNPDTAAFFAGGGVVLHIENPELLADFYNVYNISAIKGEKEFTSRIPDDIAMVPVEIVEDATGVKHIKVMCIQSASLVLEHSAQFESLRDAVRKSISDTIHNDDNKWGIFQGTLNLSVEQIDLLKTLDSVVEHAAKDTSYTQEQQLEFVENCTKIMQKLYDSTPRPTEAQLEKFNKVKVELAAFSATYAELEATHKSHSIEEKVQAGKEKFSTQQAGLTTIIQNADRVKALLPFFNTIQPHLDVLNSPTATLTEKQNARKSITTTMTSTDGMWERFSHLLGEKDAKFTRELVAIGKEVEQAKTGLPHLPTIKDNIDILLSDSKQHNSAKKIAAAEKIIEELDSNPELSRHYPKLKDSVAEMITTLNTISNDVKTLRIQEFERFKFSHLDNITAASNVENPRSDITDEDDDSLSSSPP